MANGQLLDAGLLKYVWSFIPPGTEELRELNICETKNCKINVCKLDLKKLGNCGAVFYCIYLFMDFILLWHKITLLTCMTN